MIEVRAPAKVNLTLHVTGRTANGYHLLDSLVVFADVADLIKVEEASTFELEISGPFAKGVPIDDRNLVTKAARHLNPDAKCRIHLTKNLPHGAGVGGGSADAAAALRALSNLWGLEPPSIESALTLGADVPVCTLSPAPVRMQGIGEQLTPVSKLPKCWMLLVNPNEPLATSAVFDGLRSEHAIDNVGMDELPAPNASYGSFCEWLHSQRNDLTAPASSILPVISEVLCGIRLTDGCGFAAMSGSGSTCFGLFENKSDAELAASELSRNQPTWWVQCARMLS